MGGAVPGQANEAGKLPPVDAAAAGGMTPEKINEMVERLAAKLKANPGDLEGWVRLARAYKVQGKLEEAENAFAKGGKLVEGDADLLAQYADLVAMRTKSLQGKPADLAKKALAINPKHPIALMLAATAAYQRNDFAQAIGHWETALTVLPPGSQDAALVQQEIADARSKMGGAPLFKAK
jgi:cytochrome c-type biogenesis protein CcmH